MQLDTSKASMFMALPSELRNEIFEWLALGTALNLAPKGRKYSKPVAPLLVCRQWNREYSPILLANARLSIRVVAHLDFNVVATYLDALPEGKVKALSANRRLFVLMSITQVPEQLDLENLDTWMSYRCNEVDHSAPNKDATDRQRAIVIHYEGLPKPSLMSTGVANNNLNMKVALLSSVIRMIPRLGGKKANLPEKERMIVDLTRGKDNMIGLVRTDEDRRIEVDSSGSDALEDIRRQFLPLQLR
ncbi:hypothetical protein LTR78_004192 [Recurvomyces mirabilis]|uniref:F-box domain-containing protein n=1 Tax=Recurvomyces mirabilis TaxID=574656 RepID=A0AAE1C2S2_9PEZI|nr:hypothetical protein LTR78_004192 [Recurvomyces mirabilis]KAK5153638.1 hypothetical protein LTS14_007332 [Recurvomyces mirabilis]